MKTEERTILKYGVSYQVTMVGSAAEFLDMKHENTPQARPPYLHSFDILYTKMAQITNRSMKHKICIETDNSLAGQ
jgi:hypothetical protein